MLAVIDVGDSGCFFFFQAEDGIRDHCVTGVQTCALPILSLAKPWSSTAFRLALTYGVLLVLTMSIVLSVFYVQTVGVLRIDRKSTRLNSSHTVISYAVFCLKKKKKEPVTAIAASVGSPGRIS